jgi:hypothetical protein
MEDELILSEKDRQKLDGIVNKMVQNKEPDDAINFVVNDFKGKYGVKKKEPSEALPSKPSERPFASATSAKVPAPFGEIPKFEAAPRVESPSVDDTPNWYNVAKSALGQTYEIGKSALLKAASYNSPLATPLTREIIDTEAKAAVNKIREEGPKFEQSFTQSIAQGKFGDAALQAEEFLLGTAPLAITSAAITIGTGGAGTPAALALMGGYGAQSAHIDAKGEKFYEEMSPLMRAGYTSAMGGLEILGEGIGGKILSKAAMKFAAQELSKEAFDQTAKEIVKGALKSNGVAITEEALAEFTTGFGQSAVDQYARNGKIDFAEALRQGGESAAMGAVGGAFFNAPSTVADATALANSMGRDLKNVKARNEINKYKEKLDASSTVEEQDYYAQKLAESIKTRTRNATEDAKFYESVGSQNPQDLEKFLEIDNDIKRYSSMAKVIKDADAVKDIKEKVSNLIEQQKDLESKYRRDDSEKEAGVPSPVVEGEAVVEAQPIEGAGQETPEASRVLQVPIEEGAEVTETAVVTPVADFVDRRVSFTTPSGQAVEGFLFDEGAGKLVVEDDQGNKYDIGNIEEVGQSDATDFGVAQAMTEDFDVNNEGNFVIRGQEYVNNYSNPEAAIQRDADNNVVSVTLDTPQGAKRTFRGPIADTIAYNITMAQTAETINEVETPIERPVSTVIAAPFFNTTVASVEEARNLRNTPEYKQQQDIIRREANLTGVEIVSVDESIGGFENSKGEKIVEVSNIIRVRGDKKNVDEFAAMMGSMSVETQEATIAADYVKAGSENHNADELEFVVGNIDGAIKALKAQGFYDFTINDSKSTITILDFSLGQDEEFKKRIGNLALQLRIQKINYEAKERRALDSRYIGPETRTGILGQLQEDSVQRGQTRAELRDEVSKAISRNEEIISFLSGEQAIETATPTETTATEEVVAEEEITEPEVATAEVTAVEAVTPEPGKGLDDIYTSYKKSITPRIDPKTILEGAKKQLIDRQSKIKNAVLELGLRTAYDRIVNKAGASARANDKYKRAEKKIYIGLSEKDIETLDKIIFARRVIQVDKNFDNRRLDAEAKLKSAQDELSNWKLSNIGKKSSEAISQEKKILERISQANKDIKASQRPKHPLGYTSENAKYELEQLKEKLGDQKYNDLIKRSDAYFDEFRSTLKDLYDAGLVSEQMYEDLKSNDYQPRKFIEHVFDFENSEFLIKDFGLSKEQIKAIGEGSEKDLIMSSRFLLGSYMLSASKRIFANRANRAVAEAIGKEGANDWVRSLDEGTNPDGGFTKVYFFEDGAQQAFQLRTDLKRELDNMSSLSSVDGKVGNFFSMLSGTPVIKLMATRANPLFAFKNFPRDLGHILFFTNVYDKHNLYYATYLIFRDFAKGLKSSIGDTQDFREYMDLGGGMDFISIQGRDGNFVSKSAINKTVEGIGKLGEWSEVGFRIGVYKRFKDDGIAEFEKKNGEKPEGEDLLRIKERAVAKAREIIDFSQGGEAVKAVDKFVPYLNAAFQGFRVGATYVANNPKKFASKFVQAQMGLLALSFFNAFISDEDEMENIPEHTRLMNFIIFLPSTRVDEDGKTRRKYILIPKTQQAAPFFALMDVANRKILNDVFGKEYNISEDEYTYIINGMRKGLPIGDDDPMKEIASLIPTINAAFTYKTGYDTFRDRMISMDMGEVLPAYEGVNDPNVEQFYKVLGETADVSPIRTKTAVEKLITGPNSSFIVGMSYGILDAVASQYQLDRGDYDIKTAEKETKNFAKNAGLNFSKAFVRESDPSWNLYNQKETLDKIDMEAGTERARLRTKAKELSMGTNNKEQLDKSIKEAEKIASEIAEKNPVDAKYFIESFKSNIGESPASQQSVEIQYSASDKARAEKIKLLYNPQTEEDLMMIMREVYQQTGYKISPKTIYEYQQAYGKLK